MKSKLSFLSFLAAFIVTAMAPFLLYMSATSPAAGMFLPSLYLLFVVYFWLTEFRTRAHKVTLEKERISVRQYFGLGKVKSFQFCEFDGFITSKQPGKLGDKEYIFLLISDNREICISQFYHRNYAALKPKIEEKLPFLGEKEYRFGFEYKQMFK